MATVLMSRTKEFAKRALSSNVYLEDAVFRVARYRKNEWVYRQIQEISQIDSLRDFDTFQREVVKLKRSPKFGKTMFELAEVGAESRYYGHLNSLAEYAGLSYEESFRIQLPYVEHGIRFQEDISPSLKMKSIHCIVSQGEYLKGKISSVLPGVPQFCIGPYIHYAKSSMSDYELETLKKELGNCLLVFPAHSIETKETTFDEMRLVEEIEAVADGGFDNILCCFYWNDVDSALVDRVRSIGAVPVSAGMRGDSNFISRLSSVMHLSAAATGNTLGTHIGYCLHLGIPYRWLDVATDGSDKTRDCFKSAAKIFARQFDDWSTLENLQTRVLFERYWGGKDLMLTPSEMECLFEITKEALSISHGCSSNFPNVYQLLLEMYRTDVSKDSNRKYLLLSRSLRVG